MTSITVQEFHAWYHRTRRPETIEIGIASRITGCSVSDLACLQASCDKYSLLQPVKDSTTDFLFCCGCGAAVHAFKTKSIQQFACTFCSRFLCSRCVICSSCGVSGSLVSTGDINTGRISEYCTKQLIHGCELCDAFFYNTRDATTHQIRHLLSDKADTVIQITKSAKYPEVGVLVVDAHGIRATFAPYPRRITSNGRSFAGFNVDCTLTVPAQITAVFTDPELCPSNRRRCDVVVAHLSQFLLLSPTECLPRPLCFLDPLALSISARELSVFLSIIRGHCTADTVQLVFYVPPAQDGSTNGFCLCVLDIPWQQIPVVVCPGCGEWLKWADDAVCRHINISKHYILTSAVRVDPETGQVFQFTNACAKYAHASDLSHELLHLGMRTTVPPTPTALCFGTYITPQHAPSRSRFIGVIVTDTSIVCMHCAQHITSRAGHTATSMLYPLAAHWHVSESDIILFKRQTGTPESITSIM